MAKITTILSNTTEVVHNNTQGLNDGDYIHLTQLEKDKFDIIQDITQYTNEESQDAIGNILLDTSTIDLTYNDDTPSISADVKPNSITSVELSDTINISEFINDSGYITDVNLGYTPSLTNGIVTNDKGTDAIIPVVDFTNAGLLTPEEKQLLYNNASTGVTKFDGFSINTDTTKFDRGIVEGWFVDNTTNPNIPTKVFKSFPATTGNTLTNIATQNVTYISIDINGVMHQNGMPDEPEVQRDWIPLGVIVHSNRVVINAINNQPVVAISPNNQLSDLIESIGFFNISGNVFTPNGTNLNINKSAGHVFKQGSNFLNNNKDPHTLPLSALVAPNNIRYRTQTGIEFANTAVIDTGFYDLDGVRTAIPGTRWSIQRIYLFQSNLVRIQYGQATYTTQTDAIQAITTEKFEVEQNILENGLFRGLLIVREGTTDLTDTSRALFIEASKFGSVAGLGSLSTTSLQQAYNNSLTPEITTNSTLGAVSIKRGSTLDTDNIFEGQNGAGGVTSSITGNGALTALTYNGYTPENLANKQNSLATDGTGIKYPTVDAISSGTSYKRTIAQIRLLSGTLPNNNIYTTDLGQEGDWYYDASDTTSTDNTGTILVTADGKRIKRVYSGAVNVSWYGVFPNLGSNFSSNLITILGLHNDVFIPSGNYNITIPTSTTFSNKIIKGVKPSWNGTSINAGTKITGSIALMGNDNLISNIGIYNLSGNGVTISTNASRNTIDNCIFNVQDHGVLIEQFGGTATDNAVHFCDTYGGIHGFVSKSKNTTFLKCRSFTASQDGFALVSDNITGALLKSFCLNNALIDCEVYNTNTGVAIYSRDYFSTTNTNAISLLNLRIIGGNIDTCSAYGIRVGDDTATGSVPAGQTYNDVANVSISGISIQNTTTYNIQLARSNGTYLGGNNFKGIVNKQGTFVKNFALSKNSNVNFSQGSSVYNTINTVNSTTIDASLANDIVETNNTISTTIGAISNGKVGQIMNIFINDDFTFISKTASIRLTKTYIKGKGSYVILKYANDGSGWDEMFSYSVGKFQFFSYASAMTIDYKFSEIAEAGLTGNVSSIVFTNMLKSSPFRLIVKWDGTTRTIAGWDSRIIWLTGVAPASVGSDRLVLEFYYDGTNIINTARSDYYSVSPTFTGTPLAPTATAGTNTTQIATTAFVTGVASKWTASGSDIYNANAGNVGINVNNPTTGKLVVKPSGAVDSAHAISVLSTGGVERAYLEASGNIMGQFFYGASFNSNTFQDATGSISLVNTTGSWVASRQIKAPTLNTNGYTVSTLPTGVIGATTYVTDATAPTYLGSLTGGGSVVCPVFYNGTIWVSN